MSKFPAYRKLNGLFFEGWVAGSILNLDSVVESRLHWGKSMKKALLKSLVLAAVGSFGVIGAANALPVLDGGLSITYTPVDTSGASASITAATGIDTHILVYGLGLVSATGYQTTPGARNFTGQGGKDAHFSWSASADADPQPEPATMLLLGTGLVGLASLRRRRDKHIQAM